jgi:hypothetical protein
LVLPFISKAADVRHRIRLIPAASRSQTTQPVRWPGRSLAQDDHAVGDADVQTISRFDPEIAACFTGDNDLVLGADLDA